MRLLPLLLKQTSIAKENGAYQQKLILGETSQN